MSDVVEELDVKLTHVIASSSPLSRYHKLVESGVLRYDQHQERIIGKLQKLHEEIAHYHPAPIPHEPPRTSLVSPFYTLNLLDPHRA